MNAQYKKNGNDVIGTGIEWTHRYGIDHEKGVGSGYTWNPVGGCQHDCQWDIGGGSAECYAKTVADRMRGPKFFADGFREHYWHPGRLTEPLKLKTPAGIFLDSMSDLMGHWVPHEQIDQVLDICTEAHWHTFFLLTKNPARLKQFRFPSNVWVGISVPPTRMNGKSLTEYQQRHWLETGLATLMQTNAKVKWLSAEPLTFDIAPQIKHVKLGWCVIGAASDGRKHYQPAAAHVESAIAALRDQGAKIFFKGNLDWSPRLEEYPE